MGTGTLRSDEWVGLGLAALLHVVLATVLMLQPEREVPPEPQRITVNLATDVGLQATSPDPVAESQASVAPILSEEPAPPQPEPVAVPEPIPAPRPVATTPPKPKTVTPPSTAPRRRPDTPSTAKQSTVTPPKAPPKSPPKQATGKSGGGSRLGDNFLQGAGDSTTTSETRIPAAQIGPSAKASLVQAIARKIKPKWTPPDGPEVDKITTYLRFRLNPDGSLAGRPEVIRQTGINDTNRAQAARHAENAIRAVQLAAPFDDLPPEYYNAWKLVSPFSFDWKLSQ